ncbi:hypothetical protein GCM10027053_43170 [Intrasporangium mesophilum]
MGADLVHGQLLGRPYGAAAGVVEQDIDVAMVGEDALDARAGGVVLGDVEGPDVQSNARLGRGGVEGIAPRCVAHRRDDSEPPPRELDGRVQAHAGRGARDEGGLAHGATIRPRCI